MCSSLTERLGSFFLTYCLRSRCTLFAYDASISTRIAWPTICWAAFWELVGRLLTIRSAEPMVC